MEKEKKQLKVLEKQVDKKVEEVKKKEVELEKREKVVDKKVEEIDKKVAEVKKLSLGKKAAKSAKVFKKEFQKAVITALLAAFGFIIALAWRDAITEYVGTLTKTSPIQGAVVTAVIVTFISVVGILILTKFMPKEE